MKLTSGIYGWETNPKKTPFGLLNNQIRHDSVINSAGWYNSLGEKLGSGDLSMKDIFHIAANISSSDIFIVLSEADTLWNLPRDINSFSPGIDYVMQNAIWIIEKTTGVFKIKDNISKPEVIKIDGGNYNRIPRGELFAALKYTPKKIVAKQPVLDFFSSVKSATSKTAPSKAVPPKTSAAKPSPLKSSLPTQIPIGFPTGKKTTVKKVGSSLVQPATKPKFINPFVVKP